MASKSSTTSSVAAHSFTSLQEYVEYNRTYPSHRRLNQWWTGFDSSTADLIDGRLDPVTGLTAYLTPPAHMVTAHQPAAKQTAPFLRLPGELRNVIYNLVLPADATYEVVWLGPSKRGRSLTHWRYKDPSRFETWNNEALLPRPTVARAKNPASARSRFFETPKYDAQYWEPAYRTRRRREMHVGHRMKNVALAKIDPVRGGPAALLRVCKIIHDEAAQLFYSRARVCFASPSLLDAFKLRLTPVAAHNLTRLALTHRGYGESMHLVNQKWKQKHDAKWAERIKALVTDFPGMCLSTHF